MTQETMVRAWKDPAFRAELSETELRAMPENPAGMVELDESEMTGVTGGTSIPCSIMFATILLLNSCDP